MLITTVGLGQVHGSLQKPPLITAGDDVVNLGRFPRDGQTSYSVGDVIGFLLS